MAINTQDSIEKTENSKASSAQVKHDIFTDPAIVRAKREDPFVQFVAKYWQRLALLSLFLAALVYGYNRYTLVQMEARQRSALTFTKVFNQYAEIERLKQEKISKEREIQQSQSGNQENKTEPKKEDAAKLTQLQADLTKLNADLSEQAAKIKQPILALKEAKPPYSKFADLYSALSSSALSKVVADSEAQTALTLLEQYNWTAATEPAERLVAELAALTLARQLIDSSESAAKGRTILTELVRSGEFVGLSALRALQAISASLEELKQFNELREQYKARHPEQIDLIERKD